MVLSYPSHALAGNALATEAVLLLGLLAAVAILGIFILLGRRSPAGALAARVAVVVTIIGIIVVAEFARRQQAMVRHERAREAVVLSGIDMWPDAISSLEDVVRIRFRFRNMTDREVEAFNVHFRLRDRLGHSVLEDRLSISNGIDPRGSSSWTIKYWASGPQEFTAQEWERLTRGSIEDFEVEWIPEGLAFKDGEVIP